MNTKSRLTLEQMSFASLLLFAISKMPFFCILAGILLFILVAEFGRVGTAIANGFYKVVNTVGTLLSVCSLGLLFFVFFFPYAVLVRIMQPRIKKAFLEKPLSSAYTPSPRVYNKQSFETLW